MRKWQTPQRLDVDLDLSNSLLDSLDQDAGDSGLPLISRTNASSIGETADSRYERDACALGFMDDSALCSVTPSQSRMSSDAPVKGNYMHYLSAAVSPYYNGVSGKAKMSPMPSHTVGATHSSGCYSILGGVMFPGADF